MNHLMKGKLPLIKNELSLHGDFTENNSHGPWSKENESGWEKTYNMHLGLGWSD